MTPLDARRAHDIGDFCDRLFASVDGRRMAETPQSGSVRSTTSAVPEGQTPSPSQGNIYGRLNAFAAVTKETGK